jgi:hypothetical protein
MAQYTLAEAAKATGKSKSTVLCSIRAGRLSAVRDELTGGWMIEPAELHRLYPEHGGAVRDAPNDEARNGHDAAEMVELRARLADAHETITDLRHRLDQADTDRRQALDRLATAQERVAALLSGPSSSTAAWRSWWPWVIVPVLSSPPANGR